MADVKTSAAGGYVEFNGGDRRSASAVAAYVEYAPDTTTRSTATAALVEYAPDATVRAKQTAAYVERSSASGPALTQVLAYVEFTPTTGTVSTSLPEPPGAQLQRVIGLVGLEPSGTLLMQLIAYAELTDATLYATKFVNLVEVGLEDLRVTKFVNLLEIEYEAPPPPEEGSLPAHFPASSGTRKMHRLLPDEVTGYAFDPEYSWWSSIVAEESTNMILNPSFEAWNDLGIPTEYDEAGDLAAVDYVEFGPVGATAGRRCVKLTSGDGSGWLEYDAGLAVVPGGYTFSCDVYVTRVPFVVRLSVTGTGGSGIYAQRSFDVTSTGWQRLHISYVELAAGNRECRLTLLNTNPSGVVVYTDAWQFEAKPYPTTYLDGDMIGFSDTRPYQSYYWHGEPHRSMSTRRATTGSGGRVVSWSREAHFLTTSIVGLGMTTVEQQTQTLGDGREVHLSNRERSREFTIIGRIFAKNHRLLLNRRNDLMRLLRPNNTLGGDQMILRFQEVDDAERLVGAALDIVCVYREGLQGNTTNLYQENLPLQFRAVSPFPMDVIESQAALAFNQALVHNSLVYRDEFGEYHNLGTGATTGGVVARVGFLRDGSMVALGNFTGLAGVAVAAAARWDGSTWVQLGTGDAPLGTEDIDDGYKLGYPLTTGDSDGNVYEYDDLSNLWTALGDGFIGSIYAIHRDTYGDIYVAGEFEFAADGVTVYNNVAKWDAQTEMWEPLGEGVTDPLDLNPDTLRATSVVAGNDGYVYFGGSFEQGDWGSGTAFGNAVLRWNITEQVWEGMGSGLNGTPNHMIRGQDGYIYAVGNFDQNGTETYDLRGFARWNGYTWEEVFPLRKVNGDYGADRVFQDADGIFWFSTFVTSAPDDLFEVEGLGQVGHFGYRNGIFYPPYMVDTSIYHMAAGPGGRTLHVVRRHGDDTESVVVPSFNEITYDGSADAPLAVHIEGPGQFFHLLNHSTEGGVYGRGDFILSSNEEVLVRSDAQRAMIYSNQRFNLQPQISVGATNLKAIRLVPGLNRIGLLVSGDEGQAWLTWKNRFWGLEDIRE